MILVWENGYVESDRDVAYIGVGARDVPTVVSVLRLRDPDGYAVGTMPPDAWLGSTLAEIMPFDRIINELASRHYTAENLAACTPEALRWLSERTTNIFQDALSRKMATRVTDGEHGTAFSLRAHFRAPRAGIARLCTGGEARCKDLRGHGL